MPAQQRTDLPKVSLASNHFPIESITRIVVEEHANRPSRFEMSFTDPEFSLWTKSQELLGSEVVIYVDDVGKFAGKCWGRRTNYGQNQSSGTELTIWGYDDSFSLTQSRRFRALKAGNLKETIAQIVDKLSIQIDHAFVGRFAASDTQFVQYNETDFEFLLRMAYLCGVQVWPFRGKIYFGKPPGHGRTLDLSVGSEQCIVTDLQLGEDWAESSFGFAFPCTSAPFSQSPELSAGDSFASEFEGADTTIAKKVLSASLNLFPAGFAFSNSDAKQLNRLGLDRDREQRNLGSVTIQGPPPAGAMLGTNLNIKRKSNSLVNNATITSLLHYVRGGVRNTVIQYGRSGDFILPSVDRRPAKHLWPAQIKGGFEAKRARIKVLPCGWHPDSQPLMARVLCQSTAKKWETLRCPQTDEFVLIGFEGGNPDCPVILGSLYDSTAITEASSSTLNIFARVGGDKLAKLTIADDGLQLALKELKLEVSADAFEATSTKQAITLDSSTELQLQAQQIAIEAGKIDFMTKKG